MVKKLYRYQLPWGKDRFREGFILEWDGKFGEIAPLPGLSGETLDEALQEVKEWMLVGRPPTLPSVRFGIASAQRLLKSVKLPLCGLGPKKDFSVLKLKLGSLPLSEAIALAKEYRGHGLKADCNRAWSLEEALFFASHFKPEDFIYLEEPVRSIEELIVFSQKTHFPIALDESIHTDWSKIPSLRAIVVKPTLLGSILKVKPPLELVLSSSYESGLGLVHIANLAKGKTPLGLDTVFPADLLTHPIECSKGIFSWEKTENFLNFEKLCLVLDKKTG